MPIHYTPKTFLRQTSNDLLQVCFGQLGVLQALPWGERANHQIDIIYDEWRASMRIGKVAGGPFLRAFIQ